MNNRDLLRLAPQTLIDIALDKDAEFYAANPQQYKKDNAIGYDLAINTWLLICKEYAPYSWTYLATRIQKTGLVSSVLFMKDAANAFLENENIAENYSLAWAIFQEITRNQNHPPYALAEGYWCSYSEVGTFLMICRYLKRFTPVGAESLNAAAINDFLANQSRLKLIARKGYNPLLIELCRQEIDSDLIHRRVKLWSKIILGDVELTPGVSYSMSGKMLRNESDKVNSLCKEFHYDDLATQRRCVWEFELGETARLMTVPKSISSARTIAPEECLRQSVARRMFTLRSGGARVDSQEPNRAMARYGSETGKVCTIDLSHASDDVTWVLIQSLYADYPDYLYYLSRIRPTYIIVEGKQRVLQSFATMGNALTFLIETEVFYIIVKAAVHMHNRLFPDDSVDDTVYVYGDDIICATEAFATVVAFLTKLGFKVNEEKSFSGTSQFRESCGADWYKGEYVTSPYFPRKPMKGLLDWWRTKDGTLCTVAESLISLQHRLFDVSLPAAQYIELYIREKRSDLGFTYLNSQTTDLWGYDFVPATKRYIPEGVWEEQKSAVHSGRFFLIDGKWTMKKPVVLKRLTVRDEKHAVACQIRPTVEVEILPRNEDVLYIEYLREGPWYATDIDRVLGISTSRRLKPTGSPSSSWKKTEA